MSEEIKKIVLAYSGGLDTSVILHWLKDTYKCPVVAYAADVGQVAALGIFHILQQATGRADGQRCQRQCQYQQRAEEIQLTDYRQAVGRRAHRVGAENQHRDVQRQNQQRGDFALPFVERVNGT